MGMSVYVDELRHWAKIPWKYGPSCHLTADSLDELHAFAIGLLGMQPGWFQDGEFPHYDLTTGRRLKAVALGAIETTARARIKVMRQAGRR